jgi:hypothetical protein
LTDLATGLMWSQETCGAALDWFAALDWEAAQNTRGLCGHSDWRLPNVRELADLVALLPLSPGKTPPAIRVVHQGGHGIAPAETGRILEDAIQRTSLRYFDPAHGRRAGSETAGRHSGAFPSGAVELANCNAAVQPLAVRIYDHVPLVRTFRHPLSNSASDRTQEI